jgi:hypothetical protein
MTVVGELGHVIRVWEELDWVDFEGMEGLRLCALKVDPRHDATVVAMDYGEHFEILEHWHPVAHIEVVLEGELEIDGRREPASSLRFVPANTKYSIKVRPGGAKVLEIFPTHQVDDLGGHYVDPEVAARLNDNPQRRQRIHEKLGLDL